MTVAIDGQLAAELTQDAYSLDKYGRVFRKLPGTWTEVQHYGYSADSSGGPEIPNGGAFRIFVNDATKQIVFAFKGSTFHHDDGSAVLNDWISDLGNNGEAVVDPVVDFANIRLRELTGPSGPYAGYALTAVGHSLGGAEAQTFALANTCNAFVVDLHRILTHPR